jgi:ABC-type antimicrobial peptide transport system permease subunit
VWFPMRQAAVPAEVFEVRATGDPRAAAASVRQAIREVDPNLPVVRVRTMTEQVEASLSQDRLVARLTTAFGVLALCLACFGLYGVMSYAVSRRTPELGIRMALGATPGRVLATVFTESAMLVGTGLMVGVPLVILAGRPLAGMLFHVKAGDPATLAAAALALALVAALAGFIPARRASRVDPLIALRYE